MAEAAVRQPPTVVRAWRRLSPSLVPVLAVLTALLITIPFMVITGGEGDLGKGLNIAGTAYSALLEGSIGLVINDRVSRDNLDQINALAQAQPITMADLRRLSRTVGDLAAMGIDTAKRYGDLLARLPASMTADDIKQLAGGLTDIGAVGVAKLDADKPLIDALGQLDRSEVSDLAAQISALTAIPPDLRADLHTRLPASDSFSDADLIAAMTLVNADGIARVTRLENQVATLRAAGLVADGQLTREAADLTRIVALTGGSDSAKAAAQTAAQLDAAGVVNPAALDSQIEVVRALYADGLLTNPDVKTAFDTQLDNALSNNLVILRPGDRLLIDHANQEAGIIYTDNNTPTNPNDDRPEVVYLRLGGSALMFFPDSLEEMLVRSIPFIIAGLAVALGFKAGLFNIGAEGQLYAGGIPAAWVGFSPIFANLPLVIHLPLVLVVGILGGALWGAIPGALKAFTGAHEVITTIMLNYVAILLVDWLIKSTNPVILLDTTASTPRTPYLVDSARIPSFSSVPWWGFIAAGILVLVLGLYARRARILRDARAAIRPVSYGLLTAVGGLFLAWIGQRGLLHLGLVLMLGAVWFTDWFLNKTTLGFELRTVGANPNAARYAGMSVKRNVILAMALSGALAGLAGTIEITAVQFNMQPAFFSGVGFDAIAVALLARTNPRSMVWAGLLWGALLAGAGLMQVRANISIDLVKIIQALIIMFIAADAIIRYLWRVPQPTEKTAVSTFSKGWGS